MAPDRLIDFSTKEDSYLYKAGKASLYDDGEAKFDCTQEQLPHFLDLLTRRAEAMGWDDPAQGITPITKGVGAAAQVVDGLKDHGSYDLDDVVRTCQDYVIEGQPKHQARARQNNAAMADCLHSSISTRVCDLLLADILHWQMNSRVGGTGKKTDVGMAMFKELMRYTTLDTRSTNSIIDIKLETYLSFLPR